MELAEAIKVIRKFQAWRRGGDQPMPYPQTTGEALDALCYHAERLERELEQERQDRKQADLDAIRALGERNEARAEIAAERELADRLAAIIQLDRDGYGGQVVDPECDCCDCEYLRPIDESLAAWKEARRGTV